ncbi:outer membrane lipoprotein carrier protein LolA [Nonomuraea sp. NPDC049480]|uniref:outer membrane lipoprotein carrier protein LolA n=1 Tax=Nonomuraea sp. NPDC049480 TaxID=3364353 RepID=UPI00379FCB1E
MRRGTFVRWGVPIAAAAVIGAAIGAGPVIAAVSGEPVLPERSAQQLLADAVAATSKSQGIAPMSGTVQQTASLGLPALPQTGGGGATSPLSLLSGSHEVKVWYGGENKMRVAMPTQLNETNLIVNGDQAWYWDSATNTATKLTIKAGTGQKPVTPTPQPTDLTPQAAAERLLTEVDEHTDVRVINTAEVAGRPAYQLVLAPKAEGSLVQEVRIALDGETYVPLQVQLFAKGSAEPAYQVGFTQVTFTPPAAENFTFTPPAGAKVEEATLGENGVGEKAEQRAEHAADVANGAKFVGEGWARVAVVPFKLSDLQAQATQGSEDGGNAAAMLDTVLKSATPVSGTWGSGKLIKTKLVTALLTDDGRLLVGAVTPEEITKAAGTK